MKKNYFLLVAGIFMLTTIFNQTLKAEEYRTLDFNGITANNDCNFEFWEQGDMLIRMDPYAGQTSCNYSIDTGIVTMTGATMTIDLTPMPKELLLNYLEIPLLNQADTLQMLLFGDQGNFTLDTLVISSYVFFKNELAKHQIDSFKITSPNHIEFDMVTTEFIDASSLSFHPKNLSEFCSGEEIYFEYNADQYDDLKWEFGDGAIQYGNYVNHTYQNDGNYNVRLIINNYDTINQTIIVSATAKPKPAIYVEGGHLACPNDDMHFNTVSGNYHSYHWDFGNGSISTKPNPVYAYSNEGTYPVYLTVENTCGQTGTDTFFVEIHDNVDPWAGFHFYNNFREMYNCPNEPVIFKAEGSGHFEWSFEDGTTKTGKEITKYYKETGVHEVQLKATNGCGLSDTKTDSILIEMYIEEILPDPIIRVKNEDVLKRNDLYSEDTITLCPGSPIELFGDPQTNQQLKYTWDLGDGRIINGKEISFNYNTPGIYELNLEVENNCGTRSYQTTHFSIDETLPPDASLRIAPYSLCPGEKVYFWDNNNDPNSTIYTYSIDFGDGSTPMNDFNGINDDELDVPASHEYTAEGTYNIQFSVKNKCNNSDTLFQTIEVSNDPSRMPFYYVQNSTEEDDGPSPGQYNDWSTRKNASDHKLQIPVIFPNWTTGYDSNMYIFLWYGGLDAQSDPGPPHGIVHFKANADLALYGDSVEAYVPVNHLMPPSVGLAAIWYCDGNINYQDPSAYGLTMETIDVPMQSIPIPQNQSTDLDTVIYGGQIFVSDSNYPGICTPNIEGRWTYKKTANSKIVFEIYSNGQYNISEEIDNNKQHIIDGYWEQNSDSLILNSNEPCYTQGAYMINFGSDTNFTLFNLSDYSCPEQSSVLSDSMFISTPWENKDENKRKMACPGDTVRFQIAGGDSYEWHLEGNNTIHSTNATTYHTYPSPGTYDVFVIATNTCGRTDTLWSKVEVVDDNIPEAWIDISSFSLSRGDTLHLRAEDERYHFRGWDYQWSFGDGNTSTLANPTHVYKSNGDYKIQLTVSNGCGSQTNDKYIQVSSYSSLCDSFINANFKTIIDTSSLSVTFIDQSFGDISKRSWDLGDGKSSKDSMFIYTYKYPGKYTIYMSVSDSNTNCAAQTYKTIKVGSSDCQSDFNFIVNNTEKKVMFNDQSLGVDSWHWEFGDGYQSTKSNPTHYFEKSGLYEVCLYTENTSNGCMSDHCEIIQVGEIDSTQCIADFNYNVDHTTREVSFYEDVTGIITDGQWSFGDGTYGYEPNPVHTYSKDGIYKVCATIYNENTGCQDEKCREILIGESDCDARFSYKIKADSNEVRFIDQSTGSVSNIYYNFGDGNWSEEDTVVHRYEETGVYNVCMSTYDSLTGCMSEECKEIAINGTDSNAVLAAKFTYMKHADSNIVYFNDASTGSPTNWYWTFGDGQYVADQNPSHHYSAPGTYDVCLNVFNNNTGKSHKTCKNITSNNSTCNVDADFDYYIDNQKNSISISDQSLGNVNGWFWNFGDGSTSSKPNPTHQYNEPGYYLISLSVRDTNIAECVDYYAVFVQVGNAECKSDFDYTVDAVTKDVSFTEKASGNIDNYFWRFDDGYYASSANPSHTYQRDGLYNASLTISSSTCMDYVESPVQVGNVNCNADFDIYIDSANNTAYMTNKIMGSSTNKYWVFGDGSFSTEDNPSHQFSHPGYYTIKLSTYDDVSGCMDYHEEKILIGQAGGDCEADFIYAVNDATREISLTNKSTPKGSLNYIWDMGDGTILSDPNPRHGYSEGGYYNICLTAIANDGIQDINCEKIRITPDANQDCEAKIAFNITDTATRTVKFTNQSFGMGASPLISWQFGDGVNSNTENPEHTYESSGQYTASLRIENTSTGCISKDYALVNISSENKIQASFGYEENDSIQLKATGYPVDFVGVSHGDAAKLKWSFGDGVTDSTSMSPTHVYTAPGNYDACLEIWDPITGDYDKSCETVQVGGQNSVKAVQTSNKPTLENFPNPFTAHTYIRYYLPAQSKVSIELYKLDGTKLETIVSTRKAAGTHQLIWQGNNLPSGAYHLKMEINNKVISKMLIKQ